MRLAADILSARQHYTVYRDPQAKKIAGLEAAVCAGRYPTSEVNNAVASGLLVRGQLQGFYVRLIAA